MKLPIQSSDYSNRLSDLLEKYGAVPSNVRNKHLKVYLNNKLIVISTSPRDPQTALKKIESDLRKAAA